MPGFQGFDETQVKINRTTSSEREKNNKFLTYHLTSVVQKPTAYIMLSSHKFHGLVPLPAVREC